MNGSRNKIIDVSDTISVVEMDAINYGGFQQEKLNMKNLVHNVLSLDGTRSMTANLDMGDRGIVNMTEPFVEDDGKD